MFDNSSSRVPPSGVRVSDTNHLSDKMYRAAFTKLIEGLCRYDFNVQTFANYLVNTSNDIIRGRLMQFAIAIIDAEADVYDAGDMSHGPTNGKRLKDTADLYNMPRG